MAWTEEQKAQQRQYNHAWNETNRPARRAITKARKYEIMEWLRDYKSGLSCMSCGFSHPAALDFHHRDPEQKEFDISTSPQRGMGRERILKEIAKCDILCANCHRILHWEEKSSPIPP
jgi:hypothetical protein